MTTKKASILILLVWASTFSSCRKAVKADPIYVGHWIAPEYYYRSFIEVTPGGFGKYYTIGDNSVDNSKDPYKGMLRIDWSSKHLYIGITKFKIHHPPHVYTTTPDSICLHGVWHRKTGMMMTLENSLFHGNRVMDFYQISD